MQQRTKPKPWSQGLWPKQETWSPLPHKSVPVNPAALVVGAGIAGIQAALDIADAGRTVYLVEKQPSIGGHMATFDKTFPTLDCAACILTPKMVQVGKHPNIKLMPSSEVDEVKGFVGNFKVKIRHKATYVDRSKCSGCGHVLGIVPGQEDSRNQGNPERQTGDWAKQRREWISEKHCPVGDGGYGECNGSEINNACRGSRPSGRRGAEWRRPLDQGGCRWRRRPAQ